MRCCFDSRNKKMIAGTVKAACKLFRIERGKNVRSVFCSLIWNWSYRIWLGYHFNKKNTWKIRKKVHKHTRKIDKTDEIDVLLHISDIEIFEISSPVNKIISLLWNFISHTLVSATRGDVPPAFIFPGVSDASIGDDAKPRVSLPSLVEENGPCTRSKHIAENVSSLKLSWAHWNVASEPNLLQKDLQDPGCCIVADSPSMTQSK